jgi:hypothetical protein
MAIAGRGIGYIEPPLDKIHAGHRTAEPVVVGGAPVCSDVAYRCADFRAASSAVLGDGAATGAGEGWGGGGWGSCENEAKSLETGSGGPVVRPAWRLCNSLSAR